MIPVTIKRLVEKYCMGLEPTEAQENEIMDAVKAANLDADSRREVVSYMAELMAGPTREEVARRKAAEEAAKKAKEAEVARKRAEEERALAAEKERISKLTPSRKFEEGKQLIKGKDYDKGIELIKMASGEGHADATIFLALGFKYGTGGVKRLSVRSDEYFSSFIRQADESHKDYPRAHYELALSTGRMDLLQKAAELGYVDALSTLAFGYDFGNGFGSGYFPKDEILALKYYEAFVSKGDKSHSDYKIALYNMGQMYYYGTHGVSIDEEKALSFYKKSAALGYENAKKRLSEIEKLEKEQLEALELKKRQDEARKAKDKKKFIIMILFLMVYLFFSIRAIHLSHPFWVLFWGVIGVFYCIYSILVNYYFRKYIIWMTLIPGTINGAFFIIRAINLSHPFWMWFWIVLSALLLFFLLRLFFFLTSNNSSDD